MDFSPRIMKKIAFVLPPTYGKGLSPGWKATNWLVTLLKKIKSSDSPTFMLLKSGLLPTPKVQQG
jgi:hypothetical protein